MDVNDKQAMIPNPVPGWHDARVGDGDVGCCPDAINRKLAPKERGSNLLARVWAIGLITQLLQVTHAQWIYRCLLVHDHTTSTLITLHKTKLLEEIANQLSMGAENLMEDNKYLLECNLLDIATTNGEQQEYYWLLAIKSEWPVPSNSKQHNSNAAQTRRCMGNNCWRNALGPIPILVFVR